MKENWRVIKITAAPTIAGGMMDMRVTPTPLPTPSPVSLASHFQLSFSLPALLPLSSSSSSSSLLSLLPEFRFTGVQQFVVFVYVNITTQQIRDPQVSVCSHVKKARIPNEAIWRCWGAVSSKITHFASIIYNSYHSGYCLCGCLYLSGPRYWCKYQGST